MKFGQIAVVEMVPLKMFANTYAAVLLHHPGLCFSKALKRGTTNSRHS